MKISLKLILCFTVLIIIGSVSGAMGWQGIISGKSSTQMASIFSLIIVFSASLGGAFWVSRSITSPLSQLIGYVDNISQGSSAVKLDTGRPVNCSDFKKCGKSECPSFGKVDSCWVTSGSFAVVKHCPRAMKGEDCRTCDIYGAKTEIEELGSILTGLSKYFQERESLANDIANGDLTKEVELASKDDALGNALKTMQNSLRSVLGNLQTSAIEIAANSGEISRSSQSLSETASESSAALEEITSAITQLSSQTNSNAENANQAQKLTAEASAVAEDGSKQMRQMLKAVSEISDSSQSISKIIKVIDEIAFQTNLLALNAAVEAARAGRHGKGFAVVAEEVRNLATRSAKAAKETAELIEDSVARTERGSQIAGDTASSLEKIVEGTQKVSALVDEIANASNEQATGLKQINQGTSQIDQMAQENAACAEQSSAASQELAAQAGMLQEMVAGFKLDITSQESAGAPPAMLA
jgi:methyl-accepting chemotaxis protein